MVSNNLLAVLMVVVMAISIAGAGVTLNILGVMPLGGITGAATGTTTVTITTTTTISVPTDYNIASFGSIAVGSSYTTLLDYPNPFVIRNDGSVDVNITIEATDLWAGTGGANPSYHYQYNSSSNETGTLPAETAPYAQGLWTNMPASGNPQSLANLTNYTDSKDQIEVNINITVPDDEPAGAKSSTVTFVATQA